MKKILIVDDDKEILKLIRNILEIENLYKLTLVNDINYLNKESYYGYDLIILDIMLGTSITGIDICKMIRDKINCPIIFLTAKTTETDLIEGFEVGADDYIKKPFSPKELMLRVVAHINRDDRLKSDDFELKEIGGVSFHIESKRVFIGGENINLTNLEYKIAELLAFDKNRIFSIEDIYFKIYDIDTDSLIRSVSEHIYQMRKKFKKYNVNPVKTVWGIGYKWVE